MPELPEVESVRRGLGALVPGRTVAGVEVRHPRLLRDQPGGPPQFTGLLAGASLGRPDRRGKFLWLPLLPPAADPDRAGDALVVHLGMSGQVRVVPADTALHPHTRVVLRLDDGNDLRFVDQRMFGRLRVDDLVGPPDGGPPVPASAAHIARDPLDARFVPGDLVRRLRTRRTVLKRALLDQTLVSGIGNIYADEALWRARLSGERPTATLPARSGLELVAHVQEVLAAAVRVGGTSFDALYVDVNGASGRYSDSLAVYGREGGDCRRCGAPIRRAAFTNRSSFSCPSCQPPPRRRRPG